MTDGRESLHWSPRVPKEMIQRLYRGDARGLLDEGLLDAVGWMLLRRCQDILTIYAAKRGQVLCPRGRLAPYHLDDKEYYIQRQHRGGDPRDEVIRCPVCSWQITWGEYAKSFKRRQLNPGGAVDEFQAYVTAFPAAGTPQQKMIAVDRLVHAFHRSLVHPTGRPAGVNLVQGRLEELVPFLDELTYGDHLPADVQEEREAWRREMQATCWGDLVKEVVDNDE